MTFNDMVKKQRSKNNTIAKDNEDVRAIVQDLYDIQMKVKEITSKMYDLDWNDYDLRGFPIKMQNMDSELDEIIDGLEIQFL